ncbi:MAG: hypothetical protein FD174_4340 [Geobacteraceae bacterium]|nr:MAG: hypothetical protein FD174_4340 [Geobacteraceae bacterium]
MPRWTTSSKEMEKISEISGALLVQRGPIFLVTLENGEKHEGIMTGFYVGTNQPNPIFRFHGHIILNSLMNSLYIDMLDIRHVISISTPAKLKEYEDLGLLRSADYT